MTAIELLKRARKELLDMNSNNTELLVEINDYLQTAEAIK